MAKIEAKCDANSKYPEQAVKLEINGLYGKPEYHVRYLTRDETSELIRQLQTALLELDDIGIPQEQVVS